MLFDYVFQAGHDFINDMQLGVFEDSSMMSRKMNLIKLRRIAKLTAAGERVCLKDSKYILFETLVNRKWKGCTSSCRLSKPDLAIWLARPAGASTALPCPMC